MPYKRKKREREISPKIILKEPQIRAAVSAKLVLCREENGRSEGGAHTFFSSCLSGNWTENTQAGLEIKTASRLVKILKT